MGRTYDVNPIEGFEGPDSVRLKHAKRLWEYKDAIHDEAVRGHYRTLRMIALNTGHKYPDKASKYAEKNLALALRYAVEDAILMAPEWLDGIKQLGQVAKTGWVPLEFRVSALCELDKAVRKYLHLMSEEELGQAIRIMDSFSLDKKAPPAVSDAAFGLLTSLLEHEKGDMKAKYDDFIAKARKSDTVQKPLARLRH